MSGSESPGRSLHVVTLVDSLMTSGGEILATRIAMALDQTRFQSVICATRPSAPHHVHEVEAAGVRVVALDRRSTLDVGRWRPFVKLLRDERVDVVHAHKHGSNVWAASLGRLAGVPVVVAHEHSWSYIGQPLRRALDRHLVARHADVVVGTSHEHWRRLIDVQRIDPAKARYVSNAVPPLGPGNGATVRRELNIPAASPVIGTVCTLRAEKALEVLIEAAAILIEDSPDLRVLIAGDGPERPRLEELVERLNLVDSVLFLGRRSRETLADLLDALDVAVSSSDFEAAPLSIMEFMAAAKAIVATRVGGVPGMIEDGRDGLLVPPRDPAGLARAIAALLGDPARRRTLAARARERQRGEFNFELMVRRLENLYECLYWSSDRGRREATDVEHSSCR
jgi:glycosyltransferase involved in cell wall biosynthesis